MFDVKSMFFSRELCAREYKKLDNVFFKDVYAKNDDGSLLDRTIYVFADQESIVLEGLYRGMGYSIEKMDKIVSGAKPPFEKIYVVVLNAIGYRQLNIDYKGPAYHKMRSSRLVTEKLVASR